MFILCGYNLCRFCIIFYDFSPILQAKPHPRVGDKYVPKPNDKDTVVIYSIKDGEKMPGEDHKLHKSRVLFMS